MNNHELLIRHALGWAERRKRPLDREVLQTALDLRDVHDQWQPQNWPAGSVEHLMLVRWPSHGPSEPPEVEAVVQTLDSFWRFLRATGRMSSASADPKALAKEARRSATGMRAACADPSRHGAAKSMLEFGSSIGLSLDEAGSMEEVQERLQQVMDAWNALPEQERRSRAPFESSHQGSALGRSATQLVGSLTEADQRDDVRVPRDEYGKVPFADLTAVAAGVRDSSYVQQCRRLAEWVGTGRPVTPRGVLRLAPAGEAYAELDLWEWERDQLALLPGGQHLLDLPPEADELRRKVAGESFRSAGDCWPLDRLWLPCHELGLLEVGKTKATAAWSEPTSDEEWRHLGTSLVGSLLSHLPSIYADPVIGTLLFLLDEQRDSVTVPELQQWWWDSDRNFYRRLRHSDGSWREASDGLVCTSLHELSDTGAWRREGDVLHATALGHDLALVGVYLSEQGLLDD